MQFIFFVIYLQDYILVQVFKVSRMLKSSKGLDWVDQWDLIQDDVFVIKNQDVFKFFSKEKMVKVKVVVSVGMRKIKVVVIVGMQKMKVVVIIGVQKLKVGMIVGMKWIKEKI